MSDDSREFTFTVHYSGEFDVTISRDEIEPGMTEDEIRDMIDGAIDAEHDRCGAMTLHARQRAAVDKWAREIAAKKTAADAEEG